MSSRATISHNARPQATWPVRDHIATFVRCLHLLDLDQLKDWPDVTEQLFTAKTAQQTLQQRVKAVEWALYRLFEIYDPSETKDKLRPFFPPNTQLQSLNLRAALCRCLTELKKNGVLGKDVVLRKTMLDDCKGERIEEVLANFSMSTLKKTIHISTGTKLETVTDEHLLPLVLAFRASLQNNLRGRASAGSRAKSQLEEWNKVESDLRKRLEESEAVHIRTDIAKQERLKALVDSDWIGNQVWADVLLFGTSSQPLLREGSITDLAPSLNESEELAQSLEDRIRIQQRRLAEWKSVADSLKWECSRSGKPGQPSIKPTTKQRSSLSFNEHKSLNIANLESVDGRQSSMDESYERLLVAMKQELSTPSIAAKEFRAKDGKFGIPSPSTSTTEVPERPSNVSHHSIVQRRNVGASSTADVASMSAIDGGGSISPSSECQPSALPSPIQSSDGDSSWIPQPKNGNVGLPRDPYVSRRDPTPPELDITEAPMSPSKMWMTLADRTRASMSLSNRRSLLPDSGALDKHEGERDRDAGLPALHSTPNDDSQYTNLLERTRKSMSLFSASSTSKHQKTNTGKRVSQTYPVNQFETPGRPYREVEMPPDSGTSTPRDQLFDEDAEYASIFKSRPKLALSPAFSPQRRVSGLDSIFEQDMDKLTLNSDDDVVENSILGH